MLRCLPIFLLLFLCCCKSAEQTAIQVANTAKEINVQPQRSPKTKPVSNTITLLAESSRQDYVFAYYEDEFQDSRQISFKRDSASGQYHPVIIKSNNGLWLRFNKGMAQYPVYVHPGDTLIIKSSAKGLVNYKFSGKKPGDFNFYTLLDQQAFGLGFTDIMGVEINNFKFRQRTKMLNYLYNERLKFLHQTKDSLALTAGFCSYFTNHIASVYLDGLLTPYYAPNFKLKIPQTYLDTLVAFQETTFFKQDTLVFSSEHYRRSISHYNRFLSRQSLHTPQETETLYQSANANFSGQVRDYALFSLLKEKISQNVDVGPYLSRFRQDCTYKPYVRYLDSLAFRPLKLTTDNFLLTNSLITEKDVSTNWGDILEKNKGRVIYIDLWATWCGPCLVEMPASVALHDKLINKKIAFVNITVDKPEDMGKWKRAIVTHSLNKPGYQNYMIDGKSPLAIFMHGMPNGVSVPRYILIDKRGKVASIKARRPSDPQLLQEMNFLINQ